ncbi:hypothetical protein [Acetobacterium wieringae]|uniref:hypothetical protein n=1 Tax=Acetobacterium wieringae TaxID=52694 RepID=UPI002B2084C2|nr:hypothetical protein [Acetobacterium wieringae]MEA4805103.1 hypothetical protein [Acetobacterium wieringae]
MTDNLIITLIVTCIVSSAMILVSIGSLKEEMSKMLKRIDIRIANLDKINIAVDLGDRVIKKTESDGAVTISENLKRYEHYISPAAPPERPNFIPKCRPRQSMRCEKCDRRF